MIFKDFKREIKVEYNNLIIELLLCTVKKKR